MKKSLTFVLVIVVALVAMMAMAGSVYDRVTIVGASNCVAIWTNTQPYAALQIARVCVERSLTATNVVTFRRVASSSTSNSITGKADGSYTQTIGAVTAATGAGVQATLTTAYLKYGDIVTATGIDAGTGSSSNTFTAMIEYLVQQH